MGIRSDLLEALSERVLVWDGAMGTQIQGAGLVDSDFVLQTGIGSEEARGAADRLGGKILDGCNEILNLTRPEVIESIHRNYLLAGSDIVETNTFGCTDIVLAEYEIPELVYDLSLEGARIACRAAQSVSRETGRQRWVAGAIGPGTKLVSLGQTTFDTIRDTYGLAFTAMLEAGVDALLLETLQDLLMAKAAIVGANQAMANVGRRVPLFVQVTMEQTGTMLVGSEIGAALNMLESFPGVVAVGMNCATGPVEMAPHVRFLAQNSTRPISIQPNAGLPVMEGGQAVYKLGPQDLADHHEHFVRDLGVALVGGCCGTTPAHIRAVADRVQGHKHTADAHWIRKRSLFPGFDFEIRSTEQAEALSLIGCSSLYQFVPYRQDNSFLIIGEKTNANGSKAFREMLAVENWEGLTELARELEAEGSHVLDVCTAYVGRNEAKDMRTLLGYYNRHITVPLMVDSTEWDVVEESLKCIAGKPIVNSINFEDGGERLHKVLGLCRTYGAAVVALTIDEDGMAKTKARKLEIADRIIEQTRAYGVPDHDVFFDCLTFTLGSGDEEFRNAGIETIEAIRDLVSKYPLVNTTLGVSNISFGLKPAARVVLNSAFLHYAREAGLSSAIVHFSKIRPENRIDPEIWRIASELVFDERKFAGVTA